MQLVLCAAVLLWLLLLVLLVLCQLLWWLWLCCGLSVLCQLLWWLWHCCCGEMVVLLHALGVGVCSEQWRLRPWPAWPGLLVPKRYRYV